MQKPHKPNRAQAAAKSETVRLSHLIGPAFCPLYRQVMGGRCRQLWLTGGRASGKSTFAAVVCLLYLTQHTNVHALVMRQVAGTLRNSVYAQYLWAIDALGFAPDWKCTVSPMEITRVSTGQKILFAGADDAGKLKSLRPSCGHIGFLHIEEMDQFEDEAALRSIEQSVLRGGEPTLEILSYNPPRAQEHWANVALRQRKQAAGNDSPTLAEYGEGILFHHSTYRELPGQWLGSRFINDAEYMRQTDYDTYAHEYLGVANGGAGQVFGNLEVRAIEQAEIDAFDRVRAGVDWGWYPDAWAFNRVQYLAGQRTLVIFEEGHRTQAPNRVTGQWVKEHTRREEAVVCDAAEPKSIEDYRAMGIRAQAARKGAGSVEYSMKWLASLQAIIIDPGRCPHTLREFQQYGFAQGHDGRVKSGYPDKDNHHIDAVRYASEAIWRRRGT